MSCLQELEHLRIPLDDIKSATSCFANHNILGQGGFGPVYRGQLPPSAYSSEPGTSVAVKRLNVKGGQGQHEFLMEIFMLASCKHRNLVSLLGFSDEGKEKILVYKHEVNGSLDNHLASTNLTWEQRLRICLGAARGLEYLHDGVGKDHRVLHRDIKSSNVLLDENWEAKISDFGLSKLGPANQQFTFLVTMACGTLGYMDPLYVNTGILTKESDVYSFGIVLFEVLCGRLAVVVNYEDERRFLSGLVKRHYRKGELDKIIMPHLLEQMNPCSLEVFSKVAFQCLNGDRQCRPMMRSIVQELEIALNHQLGSMFNFGRQWQFDSNFQFTASNSKEDHKYSTDGKTGDGAYSAKDSGSSQPYPTTLPGIPEGSARQLFQRLQGPMEEDTLKNHFENIIKIWQHYQAKENDQDPEQLQQPHGSHAFALSQVFPNNLNGEGVLTPLDLDDAISPT